MPLGDDVLRLVEHPEDLALAANVRLRLNAIERLIGLSNKIDPNTGNITGDLTVIGALIAGDGDVTVDNDGIAIVAGQGSTNTIRWLVPGWANAAAPGAIYSYLSGIAPNRAGLLSLVASGELPGADSGVAITAYSGGAGTPRFEGFFLSAAGASADSGYLYLKRYSDYGTWQADQHANDVLVLVAATRAPVPENGFGTGVLFRLKSTTTEDNATAEIISAWTDAAHATRASELNFSTNDAGTDTLAERLSLSETGADVTGTISVGGTQVVGARVVDARADDVANSGDATTDGLIDALRDAMITHGLIAAA